MKYGWRWGALLAVTFWLADGPARAQSPEQQSSAAAPALVGFPTCETTGTCADPTCDEPGRYVAIGGLVMDNFHERRLWQRGHGPQGDFATAQAYCASLVVQGLAGWRLPTNPEIGTIVLRPLGLGSRPDACIPSADQAAFTFPDPNGTLGFWTATPQGPQPLRYLRDFTDGRSPRTYEDDPEPWVRCVHDPLF